VDPDTERQGADGCAPANSIVPLFFLGNTEGAQVTTDDCHHALEH
jgi:hypothetical protein